MTQVAPRLAPGAEPIPVHSRARSGSRRRFRHVRALLALNALYFGTAVQNSGFLLGSIGRHCLVSGQGHGTARRGSSCGGIWRNVDSLTSRSSTAPKRRALMRAVASYGMYCPSSARVPQPPSRPNHQKDHAPQQRRGRVHKRRVAGVGHAQFGRVLGLACGRKAASAICEAS